MTRIVFLGAEVPSNRRLLQGMGAEVFGWSYARARKRGFPKTKPYSFPAFFPENSRIVVHPGTTEVTSGFDQFAADYAEFVASHLDEIDAFVEFDHPALPQSAREDQRRYWEQADDRFWPVFDGSSHGYLTELAQRYHEVVIPYGVLEADTSLAARTRSLSTQYDTVWHGMAIATPENLRQVPFATVSTLSWASPMMRGETIVWDGTRMLRYPKGMKAQARPRYRTQILAAGLDYDAVMADDAPEVARLAVWSYLKLEQSMDRKRPTNPFTVIEGDAGVGTSDDAIPASAGSDEAAVVMRGSQDRHPTGVVPAPRAASERRYLPVMGVTTKRIVDAAEDGSEVVRDVPVLTSSDDSVRQCDTCFVAVNCPARVEHSVCAFSLPVSIQTKEQMRALLSTVVEMQGARVAFAKFAEDLNGGYPDPNVGQEIDRLFRIVAELKGLEDNHEFARVTFERHGSAGVLSSIFGDRAQALTTLPNEVDPAQIIRGALED